MNKSTPVFVRGYSRSGGTLMVTVLDAHPDIAMSYELYPSVMVKDDGQEVDLQWLREVASNGKNLSEAAKKIDDRNISTFLLRCLRGGLETEDILDIIDQHVAAGDDLADVAGCLKFIERCCVRKMEREGKKRWGLKCSNQYEEYRSLWPDAHFLNMVRDGRDVLASQLHTGAFNKDPAKIGRGWANTHKQFKKFAKKGANAYEVIYEKLAHSPEEELRKICEFLGVEYSESMLHFHKQDLTIYHTNHMSMNRITKPIDTAQIGRWKKDVTPEQLEAFLSTAGELMKEYNYI